MNVTLVGVICIILLLILILISVPVGVAFILSGLLSTYLILDYGQALSLLRSASFSSISEPSWIAIPLFILLGSLAVQTGMASRAFKSADGLSAGLPGSAGIATSLGNAAFGAISGSSIAAVAVFGRTAMPEMKRLGYSKSFASGIIASAGTFASMIPPSTMFIIYALFTDTSIARLFFAGIIPGILTAITFSIYIYFHAKKNSEMKKHYEDQPKINYKERISLIVSAWPILLVAFVILGGIYAGIFTPTEAAAIGIIATLVIGFFLGKFKKVSDLNNSLKDAASTTSMIFLINIGALFYAKVLALSRLPADVTSYLTSLNVPPFVILLIICAIFFLLGMIMVPIGIYAMILPIVMPVLTTLGYDPVWFGVITMVLVEIAAITPPVGLNVFALKGVVGKEISIMEMFRGVWPFVIINVFILLFLLMFPQVSLWLPNLLLD